MATEKKFSCLHTSCLNMLYALLQKILSASCCYDNILAQILPLPVQPVSFKRNLQAADQLHVQLRPLSLFSTHRKTHSQARSKCLHQIKITFLAL